MHRLSVGTKQVGGSAAKGASATPVGGDAALALAVRTRLPAGMPLTLQGRAASPALEALPEGSEEVRPAREVKGSPHHQRCLSCYHRQLPAASSA